MHTLLTLWTHFFNLCRFKLAPQQLPASSTFTFVLLVAYVLMDFVHEVDRLAAPLAFVSSMVDVGLSVILTTSLLLLTRRKVRIWQTLSALAGANIVLGVLALPLVYWFDYARDAGFDSSLPILLLLGIIVWSIAVTGHILRHALDSSLYVGIVVSILYSVISTNVLSQLFPTP